MTCLLSVTEMETNVFAQLNIDICFIVHFKEMWRIPVVHSNTVLISGICDRIVMIVPSVACFKVSISVMVLLRLQGAYSYTIARPKKQ